MSQPVLLPRQDGNTSAYDNGHTGFSQLFSFSVGLHGVDQDSNFYFANILIAVLCVLLAATLTLRWMKMFMAQLRHMSVLGSPLRQRFWAENRTEWWPWLKREILWAPLWRTRHNREMRISEVMVMGTLPSRGHLVILLMYGISNLAFCLTLPYSRTSEVILAQLRARSGMLAALNIIPTVLFALRNNPLIRILQTPYDTFNLFHRWIGRIFIIESIIHTCAWIVVTYQRGHWDGVKLGLTQGVHAPSYTWGMVATVTTVFLAIQSWSPFRHAFYETFLVGHKIMVLITLVGVYLHLDYDKLPQVPWVQLVFVFWACEYVWRLANIFYHNYAYGHGWTRVQVEAVAGEACRVTFDLARPWTPRPGAHCHIYVPALAWFSSHPFSVAWTDIQPVRPSDDTEKLPTLERPLDLDRKEQLKASVSFIIRARTGFTKNLLHKAMNSPNGMFMTRGAVEGPYAGHDSLNSYGTVLLFAGGVGITHQVSYVKDLMVGCHNGTSAARKVILIWSVPNTEALEWVRPWMDQILRLPGRREILKIYLFVTKPRSHNEITSGGGSISMFPGRCNPQTIIDKEIVERVGAMGVTVCGPGAFADSVRRAVRKRVHLGVVDFTEEAFTY
jgi:predicted ferric reductase